MLPPLWPGSITTTGRRAGGALVGGAAGDARSATVGDGGRGTGRVLVGATVAACGAAEAAGSAPAPRPARTASPPR